MLCIYDFFLVVAFLPNHIIGQLMANSVTKRFKRAIQRAGLYLAGTPFRKKSSQYINLINGVDQDGGHTLAEHVGEGASSETPTIISSITRRSSNSRCPTYWYREDETPLTEELTHVREYNQG
jgi:hypothetical protein